MAPTAPKAGRRGDLPKPAGRVALERPHKQEHERSVGDRFRHPQSLRDHLREFREACEDEHPSKLHGSGVETERGATVAQIATAIVQGQPLPAPVTGPRRSMGGPRWMPEFRAYLDAGGSPFATYIDDHGEEQWAYPLRSSLKRLDLSRSGIDRSAAEFLYLLRRCRNHHEAWAAQVGTLATTNVLEVADAWAAEALRRWWMHFVERPRGKPLT